MAGVSKESLGLAHFAWVDVLRGVMALLVVVFHYHHFFLADSGDRASIPEISEFPYARVIGLLYSSWAAYAVEVFWAISGFVFTHVYLSKATDFWTFSVARFARLYPLHFVTLIYVAALQLFSLSTVGHQQVYGNTDLWHLLLQLGFASNWTTLSWGLSFNGPIWSVSVEVLVYVAFYCVLRWLTTAPLLLAMSVCGFCWALHVADVSNVMYVSNAVLACGGFFFMGSALYAFVVGRGGFRLAVCVASGLILCFVGSRLGLENLLASGGAVSLISFAVALDRYFAASGKKLRKIGDISYALYLVHVPLQMTVLTIADLAFDGSREFATSHWTLPIYLIVSVAAALVIHEKFERPAGKAIRLLLVARTNSSPSQIIDAAPVGQKS